MKRTLYKAKGALALALAMSMLGTQAFAAEVPAAVTIAAEEEAALPALTYEEALQKAKKHSLDLDAAEDRADYLHETKKDLSQMMGFFEVPTYDYKKWVNDGWYALTAAAFQTDLGMKQNEIGRKLTELGLEVSVKSAFTTITAMEDDLELVRKNAVLQQKLYVQGQTKNRLGMLSGYNLEQLKIAAQQAKGNLAMMEAALEQEYHKLNDLIGESADARFTLVYEVKYEPYVMLRSMEQYVNDKLRNDDLSIQLLELAVENAKFSKNYLAESDAGTDGKTREFNLDNAQRDLKSAKEEKETLIRNTYLQIQQLETQISAAEADLKKAQTDYRVAQVNYQAGNVTKTLVEQAEMGMLSAESALREAICNHDMLVFLFENPSLLVNSTTTGSAGK